MRFRTAIASLAGLAKGGCGQPALLVAHPTYDASLPVSGDRSGVFSAATEPYHGLPPAGGVNASISDMSAWLIARMVAGPHVLSAAAPADRQGASGIAGKTARRS